MKEPLLTMVGMRGTTKEAELIILGKCPIPEGLSENTRNFLDELRMP